MDKEERILNLEIKVSYMEKNIEDLSAEIIKQDLQIKALSAKLQELSDNLDTDDIRPQEKPPHY